MQFFVSYVPRGPARIKLVLGTLSISRNLSWQAQATERILFRIQVDPKTAGDYTTNWSLQDRVITLSYKHNHSKFSLCIAAPFSGSS